MFSHYIQNPMNLEKAATRLRFLGFFPSVCQHESKAPPEAVEMVNLSHTSDGARLGRVPCFMSCALHKHGTNHLVSQKYHKVKHCSSWLLVQSHQRTNYELLFHGAKRLYCKLTGWGNIFPLKVALDTQGPRKMSAALTSQKRVHTGWQAFLQSASDCLQRCATRPEARIQ